LAVFESHRLSPPWRRSAGGGWRIGDWAAHPCWIASSSPLGRGISALPFGRSANGAQDLFQLTADADRLSSHDLIGQVGNLVAYIAERRLRLPLRVGVSARCLDESFALLNLRLERWIAAQVVLLSRSLRSLDRRCKVRAGNRCVCLHDPV